MGFLKYLKRRKKKETGEERRERLLQRGRITDGVIIDRETGEDGTEIVEYSYSIQGVDFESSEILTEEQLKKEIEYAPGSQVAIRFDPNNHGNSIVV